MKIMNEMPRGPQKKLPKYKAQEIAKDRLMTSLSISYYGFENDDYYKSLSEEEQELINYYMTFYGEKMAKSIGREYYTV